MSLLTSRFSSVINWSFFFFLLKANRIGSSFVTSVLHIKFTRVSRLLSPSAILFSSLIYYYCTIFFPIIYFSPKRHSYFTSPKVESDHQSEKLLNGYRILSDKQPSKGSISNLVLRFFYSVTFSYVRLMCAGRKSKALLLRPPPQRLPKIKFYEGKKINVFKLGCLFSLFFCIYIFFLTKQCQGLKIVKLRKAMAAI